ncbi:tyrosine-protein phosphatase [Microbacterium sp. 4R-513]|uniref:tyrosine-protein phosphatase n=1 Tax=Microbacterium sp. 4R-513 TaxID=2567934 RepID=UPI0013E19AB2|nr:tyrosine-protein phosphatase [Microbacterium sp. 4R-513]QIG39725.1 tyrosine-protein phosphatase [Microbacterium sp. 4R-513]
MTTIDGLHNFRDTGGIALRRGGETRPGVLYRSDALGALTPDGVTALAETPIGVVVDFRTPEERQLAPDRLPADRPVQLIELPLLEGALGRLAGDAVQAAAGTTDASALTAAMENLPTLGDLYLGMLQHGASTFAAAARLVAASRDDEPTAVLVHCTAGKDRTGVATAVVLLAAGAACSAVVADYASSADNLAGAWAEGMFAMLTQFGIPLTPPLQTLVAGSPAPELERALDWLDAERGGAAAYLRSGGLSEDELAALERRIAG